MTSNEVDEGVMVSLPWTPTMSEFEALKEVVPKLDIEFEWRRKVEQLEAKVDGMKEGHENATKEMRQAFETALRNTNDFLVITANHVQELQNRLAEQER